MSYVYFAESGDLVKIGFSRNPVERMVTLRPKGTLICVLRGTRKLEKKVHKKFQSHLVMGREWFRNCPEIRRFMSQCLPPPRPEPAVRENYQTMLGKLSAYRLDQNLTWLELGLLCGVTGTTLRMSVKRKAISERLAAQVVKYLGKHLNGGK